MNNNPAESLDPQPHARAEGHNLNVVAEATAIYEGGNLIPVSINDLIHNEVALRQLINTLGSGSSRGCQCEIVAMQKQAQTNLMHLL